MKVRTQRAERWTVVCSAMVGGAVLWGVFASAPVVASEEPPEGVEQLLDRGAIPAVFAPEFVPASEAGMPDDAWVLGVVVEGQAKAYSLNLLNAHEVVNDEVGGKAFAAVW